MQIATAEPAQRSRLWPLLATAVGVVVACGLGTWQLGRAQEKLALKARIESFAAEPPIHVPAAELAAADVELRRVEARGTFEPRYTVFIDNRIHRSVPGYHVVTPLRIAASERYVLVNRGWVKAETGRSRLPHVPTPEGTVTVIGMAVVPGKRTLELSEHVMEGSVWQNVTIERYRAARPISIQPFMILQDSPLADNLVREWPAPDFGIHKHYGYAFQWFALAVTLMVFYAVTRHRRRRAA